jgi:hypothetical protein
MKTLWIAGLAVLAALALAGAARGSHDASGTPFEEDFVTGRVVNPETCIPTPPECFHIVLVFDAHSGPSGEHPTGAVRTDLEAPPPFGTSTFDIAQVNCLDVSGNRATVGARSQFGFAFIYVVEDNDGAGQDRSGVSVGGLGAPLVCSANPPIVLSPIFDGDITVHDAAPFPTSKNQCKQGGWREFPQFKNQGQCVAFVERGP